MDDNVDTPAVAEVPNKREQMILDILYQVDQVVLFGVNQRAFETWLRERFVEYDKPPEGAMDIAEFRKLGLLQEVNRRFFHPIGLALAVNAAKDDEPPIAETLAYIIDRRDDPEGFMFAKMNVYTSQVNADIYDEMVTDKLVTRMKLFKRTNLDGGWQPTDTMDMEIPNAEKS